MQTRQEVEEELEYKYGAWEENRVVAPGDRGFELYTQYGQPLTSYNQFFNMSRDWNWTPNWPRN
jgi:hypothetical protein